MVVSDKAGGSLGRRRLNALGLTVALVACASAWSGQAANPTVSSRQATMKAIAGQMKQASGFATGQTAWDPVKVKALMTAVAANAKKSKDLFPAKSASDPDSSATPATWEHRADVLKRFDELAKLSLAAGGAKTQQDFRAQLTPLGGTCKGCHDTYRKKPA